MNEKARQVDLTKRGRRLQEALFSYQQRTQRRQEEVTAKTLDEIRETGDSREFGESFRALDSLLTAPLSKRTAGDRDKIVEMAGVFKEVFGDMSVGWVYGVWKSRQEEESTK